MRARTNGNERQNETALLGVLLYKDPVAFVRSVNERRTNGKRSLTFRIVILRRCCYFLCTTNIGNLFRCVNPLAAASCSG